MPTTASIDVGFMAKCCQRLGFSESCLWLAISSIDIVIAVSAGDFTTT